MKKFIKVFILMLLMIIGINNVSATAAVIYVGNQEVYANGEEVSMFGGAVKFENTSEGYVLTLKNVDINDYKRYFDETYGIYFADDNLIIKLEGNNTLSFIDQEIPNVEEYDGIFVTNSHELEIVGEGTLNINANGDYDLYGISADVITIGEEDKTGPTINGNIISSTTSQGGLISGDFHIYNTNIKGKIRGELAVGIFSGTSIPCNIKNSDINFDITTSSESVGIFAYSKDLTIEDTDVLIKMHKFGDDAYEEGIVCYKNMIIKDSRIVIIASEDADDSGSLFNNDSDGTIKLIHTSGKEFLLVSNAPIISENLIYDNIENTMVYVHTNSLEDIKLTNDFNINNINELVSKSNFVITTGIDYKITNGNNQNILKGSATSYNVETNHFRYLLKEIKLNDAVLDEEDYELTKDGKVILTDTGLNKLNALDVGTYKLILDYYAGEDLEANFNIVSELVSNNEDNPVTIDNIGLYSIIGSVSLISMFVCILYRKTKYNIY